MNFERHDLGAVLRDSSHDPARPTFFSWLGVTQYLTRSAIEQTFRSMREVSVAGSEIVFTYMDEKFFAPENRTPEYGSPLKGSLAQANFPDRLRALASGFGPRAFGVQC